MSKNFKFKDVVIDKRGFLRGPFGGDLKKEIFVKQSNDTYKVYEQGVVLNSDKSIGRYYISKEDYLAKLYKFSVEDKDFLISCSGVNMGAIYQLKSPFEKGIINQALLRIRLNNDIIDDNYFYYLFKELISRRITSGSGDSTIPNFPALEVIKNIEFELPDKLTQVNVGKLLFALDSKIELNNRINAELEAMAKTLYDYWFVQFDFPFNFAQGKPDKNGCCTEPAEVKPYKTSGGKMVWNEELKREIPEGWEVDSIDSYAEVKKGELITAKDAKEGSIKVIAAGIDFSYLHSTPNRLKNTITISGSGANAGFINFWREPIFASDCITVRGKSDSETLILLQYLNFIQPHILNQATGSAQPHVYPSDIKVLNYVIPPNPLIENYGKVVLPMNEKIGTNIVENQKLAELRDWLLPMLMNGQVKVSER
jgi:type I restriction enzyme S subunit